MSTYAIVFATGQTVNVNIDDPVAFVADVTATLQERGDLPRVYHAGENGTWMVDVKSIVGIFPASPRGAEGKST